MRQFFKIELSVVLEDNEWPEGVDTMEEKIEDLKSQFEDFDTLHEVLHNLRAGNSHPFAVNVTPVTKDIKY